MANLYKIRSGTQIRFVGSGFSPADSGTDFTVGTPTDVAFTLSGVANGAGRQSAKVDLGATRARGFAVDLAVDFTGETPSATGYVELYWLPSPVSTAANGNVAGNSGADGAAPDGALGSVTLTEFKNMAQFIGTLRTHDGGVVQVGCVNPYFQPTHRYGQLLLVNSSGDAFEADNVEMACWFTPIEDIDEAA